MPRKFIILSASAMVAACATAKDPGWAGHGAQPFDEALAECQEKASVVSERKNREHILEDCMGAKGWHRPRHR